MLKLQMFAEGLNRTKKTKLYILTLHILVSNQEDMHEINNNSNVWIFY